MQIQSYRRRKRETQKANETKTQNLYDQALQHNNIKPLHQSNFLNFPKPIEARKNTNEASLFNSSIAAIDPLNWTKDQQSHVPQQNSINANVQPQINVIGASFLTAPTKFDLTKNIERWLKDVDVYMTAAQISNKRETLLALLDEESQKLMDYMSPQHTQEEAYASMCQTLRSIYKTPNKPPLDSGKEFFNRVQLPNESVTFYMVRLSQLAFEAFNNTDREALRPMVVEQFIKGLRSDRIRNKLILDDLINEKEDVLTIAQRVEALIARYGLEQDNNTPAQLNSFNSSWQSTKSNNSQWSTHNGQSFGNANPPSMYMPNTPISQDARNPTMMNSKMNNTNASVALVNNMFSSRRDVECYTCHNTGHYANACPKRTPIMSKSQNSSPNLQRKNAVHFSTPLSSTKLNDSGFTEDSTVRARRSSFRA